MSKNTRLQIRLSQSEKDIIEFTAKQEGRSLSNYVVSRCLNGTAEIPTVYDKKAVLKIAINLENILNEWKRPQGLENAKSLIEPLEQEVNNLWQSLK